MKNRIMRVAGAVLLALLVFLGLRFALRFAPVGGDAMALAAYANADALAEFLLTGDAHHE